MKKYNEKGVQIFIPNYTPANIRNPSFAFLPFDDPGKYLPPKTNLTS
jgi:hypothetical protein